MILAARHGFACRNGYTPCQCIRLWIGLWRGTMYGGWPSPCVMGN